ncbi:MAG: hypothetical protein KF902_14600 [Phycisphaeraceae bacterium]|nr:hypothetical protein [Phycisphaeraceae bacterium]
MHPLRLKLSRLLLARLAASVRSAPTPASLILAPLFLAPLFLTSLILAAPPCIAASLPTQPRASHIAEISQTPSIALWSCWLSNGTRLHAKTLPENADGTFAIALTLSGGELLEPPGKRGLAAAAAAGWSLPKSPTPAQADTIRRYLDSQIRFSAVAHTDALQLWITGPEADLPIGLDIAALLIEHPDIDADAMNARLQTFKDLIASNDPDRAAIDALRAATLPSTIAAARPLLAHDLSAIDPAAAAEWLAAATMQGSIEGAIASRRPAPDTLALAADSLGPLPGRPRISPATLGELRDAPPPEVRTITVRERCNQPHASRAIVAVIGPRRAELSERRALALAAFILDERLEADPNLSGDVRVFPTNPAGRSARSVIAAMIASDAPDADPAGQADILAHHLALLAAQSPSESELNDARNRIASILARQDLSAEAWASKLATLTYDGLSPASLARAFEEYRTITPDQVTAALRARWSPANTVRITIERTPAHN